MTDHGSDRAVLEALDRLRGVIRGLESVLVAFSGGVDSAVVARVAVDELGGRAVALTANSETYPPEELAIARRFAARWGIEHLVLHSAELEIEGYAQNAGNRCYFCKTELFDIARDRRDALGLAWIADGTVTDDLGGHRPGLRAAAEHDVRHPLVEAGLDKAAVRAIALHLGLEVWDKPSFACLGSRFPDGTRVTAEKVRRVAALETALRQLGLRQLRVRYHELGDAGGALARIEVEPRDIARVAEPGAREAPTRVAKEAGFRWVTLDLVGYLTVEAALEEALQRRIARRDAER